MYTSISNRKIRLQKRSIPGIFAAFGLAISAALACTAAFGANPFLVAHSIDVTDDQIILVELNERYTDSNLFDLENTTISFIPDDDGGYSVDRKELQWNVVFGVEMDASILSTTPNILANQHTLENFEFPFSGEKFREIYVSPNGVISFSKDEFSAIVERINTGEFRYNNGLKNLSASFFENTISPLFWTYRQSSISGKIHVNESAESVTITFSVSEPCCNLDAFTTEGNINEYQVTLNSSGQIDFSYRYIDSNMGIVGVFPKHIYGQGQLIGSFDFEVSSELDPRYNITNVTIYKTKDSTSLELIYTFAADISDVTDPDAPNWYLGMNVRKGPASLWASLITNGSGKLRVGHFFETVSEPVIHDNQLFFTLNLISFRAGEVVRIISRAQEYYDSPGDDIIFDFTYPELAYRESLSRSINFSDEDGSGLHSRIYEGFYHQENINTDWIMCDVMEAYGDIFTLGAHYSSFRLDNGAASSPVSSFNSPSKGIGIGLGFDADPRDGPTSVGGCKTYSLQSNLARMIPIGSVAGSSFGSTPYYYSSGLLAHEIGHTWIVSGLPVDVNGEIVGLSWFGGHWSDDLHSPVPINLSGQSESSTMGGVNWQDNGDGTFNRTKSRVLASGFSYLDLYLMGLIPPENVPDFFVLKNREFIGHSDGMSQYTGEKVDVTIDDIIAYHGPRFPTYLESPKDFNMALTFARPYGESIDQGKLDVLRSVRDAFLDHWCNVTGGLSTIYSEVTSKYQLSESCMLSTDLGIGTEDPTYGVAYEWPDLDISDFASIDFAFLGVRDWELSGGETLSAFVEVEGSGIVDIYVKIIFPDNSWITLGANGNISQPSEIIPFMESYMLKNGVRERIELISVRLGTGADYDALQKGDYDILIRFAHEDQDEPLNALRNITGRSNGFRLN